MSWWPRQRLGGVLLIYFISVRLVCSLNKTSEDGIPEIPSNFSSINRLIDLVRHNCGKPTVLCIQRTLYDYLEDVLDNTGNYKFNGFITFTKNNASFGDYKDNVTNYNSARRRDRAEDIGNKALRFILTHNMQIQMPKLMFEGSTLEISPRSVDGSGLITKLELIPKAIKKELGSPRIFFKKIKKFIGEKLLHALLAIVLVVALLLIKFLFFLPLLAGVAVAKKVLLKILLFFFPFLSYLFKLCPYVENAHGLTKFHHHHHQIAHLHHVPPNHETTGHQDPHQSYDIGLEYYGGGPDLSADFLHRKTDPPRTLLGDQNQIHSWSSNRSKKPQMNRPLTPAEIEALTLKAEREAVLKVRLQQEHNRVLAENKLLQDQIQQSLKVQEKLKQQAQQMQLNTRRYGQGTPTGPSLGVMVPSQVLTIPPLTEPLSHNNIPNTSSMAQTSYDSFYSPILEKIDQVLNGIKFTEEPCRERIICSMYKNPTKFSPHSNLISAQLSRDSNELQKPTTTNGDVIRFYKYVQAARDGQDKRDCLRLYPACAINTEQ